MQRKKRCARAGSPVICEHPPQQGKNRQRAESVNHDVSDVKPAGIKLNLPPIFYRYAGEIGNRAPGRVRYRHVKILEWSAPEANHIRPRRRFQVRVSFHVNAVIPYESMILCAPKDRNGDRDQNDRY